MTNHVHRSAQQTHTCGTSVLLLPHLLCVCMTCQRPSWSWCVQKADRWSVLCTAAHLEVRGDVWAPCRHPATP
jgi:hypothetical protein